MNETIGWKAASNGSHKKNWFVMHHEERRYYNRKPTCRCGYLQVGTTQGRCSEPPQILLSAGV